MTDSMGIMSVEEIVSASLAILSGQFWRMSDTTHSIRGSMATLLSQQFALRDAEWQNEAAQCWRNYLHEKAELEKAHARIAALEAEVVAKGEHLDALRIKVDNCSCDYDALGPCMHHDEITKKAVKAAVSLLERENEALRKALEETRDELWAFRGYYIADHLLGLCPGPSPEVERASATIERAGAALSKPREEK